MSSAASPNAQQPSIDFWKFWAGQTISNFGSSFTDFALPLLIFKLTGSALNLAIASATTFLPYLLFGLVIGAWVDRTDRKRLMIASALVSDAKCLLMDEPVGGLTPKEIDYILELVKRIRSRGISIILIEHVMRFLVTLSDRVMIMQQGRNIFLGTPAEMVSNEKVTQVYLGKRASDRMQAFLAGKAA